jgi:predicted phage terminase large subunit-like protein
MAKRSVSSGDPHAKAHRPNEILRGSGVGTALVAELKNARLVAVPVEPERDKVTRMSVQSGKFEAGLVLFPHSAPLLADLEAELFSFPHSRRDD